MLKKRFDIVDIVICALALLAGMLIGDYIFPSTADAAMTDCIDATCRVKTTPSRDGKYSIGTGVVFEISNGKVHVLTNAHVATTLIMRLEFWRDGHKMDSVSGVTVLRDRKRDVAVISIDVAVFGDRLPTVIPLAPRGTVLLDGQEIISAGCPKGRWTKAWIGHIENSLDGRIKFQPGPYGGQSGSALFDADGTQIVALLNLQETRGKDGPIIAGYAVNLENVYAAIYGEVEEEEEEVNYWRRQRSWPYTPAQCGPKGCPRPEKYGGKKGVPVPKTSLGDLRPEVPFVLPEIVPEVEPEVELLPGELPGGVLVPEDLADVIKAEPKGFDVIAYAKAMIVLSIAYLAIFFVVFWIFRRKR
jgi:hypothetical protein